MQFAAKDAQDSQFSQILHFIRRRVQRNYGSEPPSWQFCLAGRSAAAAEMTHFRRMARLLPPLCNLGVLLPTLPFEKLKAMAQGCKDAKREEIRLNRQERQEFQQRKQGSDMFIIEQKY